MLSVLYSVAKLNSFRNVYKSWQIFETQMPIR